MYASTPERSSRRAWPRTLYGRLVLLLVTGMLLAQWLTGTIWFDVRRESMLEMPVRIAATRIGLVLRVLEAGDAATARASPEQLGGDGLRIGERAPVARAPLTDLDLHTEHLLRKALAAELGSARRLDLLAVDLHDEHGRDNAIAVFLAHQPRGRFELQVQSRDGRWFRIHIDEGQAGMAFEPLQAMTDYLLRIYGLRALVIMLLALAVVRWLTQPLTRLAQAARALGRDIHSPPLRVAGPEEVRQAAQAFNQMQQRVLEGIQAREQMLASVSHDLRSPLTRLRLRTEMLPDDAMPERWRQDLDDMQALVDSILDAPGGATGPGPRQRVDLDSLLQAVAADLCEIGARAEVSGQAGSLPGYARSLKRAIANLMENAVRHGQRVRVHASRGAEAIVVLIDDDGPGIPEAALQQVLQPFYQVPGSDGGRAGLGLSIATTVLRAHGGTLELHNRREYGAVRGLRATIVLPLRGAEAD